ncbi:hypothetical protein DFH07DRAFT_964022 [Mycena maculata]|uniref:F-box domain-containing protein n=1 Tax=Mycena maculata TaxID=230809 RepID=A0AAD7N386_9AGAR|nr:hypothetical protein DFH07DRAFT_964022 [Mycena maculata]
MIFPLLVMKIILPLLERLPLQRLAVSWKDIYSGSLPKLHDSCAKFTQLTHLEIRDWREPGDPWTGWSGIARFPRLTHLCFHDVETMMPLLGCALKFCPHLKVLVISCARRLHFDLAQRDLEISGTELTADARFVMFVWARYFYDDDWEAYARGSGEDFWVVADRHVAKRQAGETTVSPEYFICPTDENGS